MLSPQYQQIYTPPQEYQSQNQYPFPSPRGVNPPAATPEPALRPIWKFVAALSPNILLLGYLILPVAFEGPNDKPPANRGAITSAALVLIALAYLLSMSVGFIQRRNGSFVIQHVFLPGLYSSILSLFNVVFNIIARHLLPLNKLEKAGMGLSSVFGVVYVVAALWVYAKGVVAESPEPKKSGSNDNTVELLTEEEMQRRQFSLLLEQRKKDGLKSPSPRTIHRTFRVDGPEHLNVGNSDWDRYKR